MVLRPKPEKQEERERTRKALLQATVRLAAVHGFAGLGLREVSRGADIAPTSFYRHFGDMEELGLALIEERVGPVLASWADGLERGLDASRLGRALVGRALADVDAQPELLRFLLAERTGARASCRKALRAQLARLEDRLTDALAGAGLDGLPPFVAEALVTLLLDGCADALDREPAQRARAHDALCQKLDFLIARALQTAGVPPSENS